MAASVLVVEDEPLGRNIISRILRGDGYEVIEAADGAEAKELLEDRSFDLIISDVVMPNLDGLKLLDHIRRVSRTPVILMSGYLFNESGKNSLLDKAEFLQKPFDFSVLLSMARRLIAPDPIPC
jgi:two-component system, OmpR family, response regulator